MGVYDVADTVKNKSIGSAIQWGDNGYASSERLSRYLICPVCSAKENKDLPSHFNHFVGDPQMIREPDDILLVVPFVCEFEWHRWELCILFHEGESSIWTRYDTVNPTITEEEWQGNR